MMKFLRFFLLTMVAMLAGTAMAEDIIWQEDFSTYEANAVPAGGDFSYVCVDGGSATKIYNEKLAGGTAPELLIGKKTGSFTVTIPLNGKTGTFTLSYMANYDRITVMPAQKTVTLGEKVQSGNNYTYSLTVEEGTESVILTFANENASNVRFDDAKLYQGTAKKNAGLTWGTASRTVKLEDENKQLPTLQNDNNLPVSFESNNTAVATVSDEGVIAVLAVGKATITATFEGNDEFEAQSVSVEINVTSDAPVEATKITIAEALEIINGLENGKTTTEVYEIEGYVISLDEEFNSEFGNYTFNMGSTADAEPANQIKVFRAKNADNAKFETDVLNVSDKVSVSGKLQKYVKDEVVTPEVTSARILKINEISTSGIETMKAQNRFEGAIYNLAGQRVKVAGKGLYIQNGKKFFVK